MSDTYFRETTFDELRYFAEKGYVPGEDLDALPSNNGFNRDTGIPVKKHTSRLDQNEAEGYIEVYGESLETVEQDSGVFILTDGLDISHLAGIHVQEQNGRDHLLEVANMLEPPHDEIRIRSYRPDRPEI